MLLGGDPMPPYGPISDQDPCFVKSTHPSNEKQFGTRFYVQTLPQKYFAKIAQAASTAYMLLLDATHFTMVSAWAPWLTKES